MEAIDQSPEEKIIRKSRKMKQAKSDVSNGKRKTDAPSGPKYDEEVDLKKNKGASDTNGHKKVAYQPSDFKIIKEVGEGSYGRVFLASRVSDGKMVAIKMLDKHHLIKSHKVEHVMREK